MIFEIIQMIFVIGIIAIDTAILVPCFVFLKFFNEKVIKENGIE